MNNFDDKWRKEEKDFDKHNKKHHNENKYPFPNSFYLGFGLGGFTAIIIIYTVDIIARWMFG